MVRDNPCRRSLTLALSLLVRRETPGPLDTAGQPVETGALALRAAELLGRTDLEISRPTPGSGAADVYVGDGRRYEAVAGAAGLRSRTLDEQIIETRRLLQRE